MGWMGETIDSIKSIQIRQLLTQAISLALMCVTGSESPVVIVLSGITESGFKVCIIMYGDTFSVAGRDIPIVRRVIKINHIVSLSVLFKTQLQAFNNIKLNISSGEK
uniref:Uncharacterized protein n=2 Tax=Brassica TaxID=3705 RepID=A0A0D3AUD2_BRAOL